MSENFELIIVIPCYNEAKRLQPGPFKYFLDTHPNIMLCFVNDGSLDQTFAVLTELQKQHAAQIKIINQTKNVGKANSVRNGILTCSKENDFENIAYLDADLSTSLEECYEISKQITSSVLFTFGSRMPLESNNIERKQYRHLIGRCIASLIRRQLSLDIYDTQCGCKVFNHRLEPHLFKDSFISCWLFDVEIFHRFKQLNPSVDTHSLFKEIPVKSWIDTEDSRVPFSYALKLWVDLFRIRKFYKKTTSTSTKNETVITI